MNCKYIIVIIVFTFLSSTPALCMDKWDTQEKVSVTTFIVGQVLNYGQIRWVQKHPNWYEINGVLDSIIDNDRDKLIMWKVGTTLAGLGIAHLFDHK